MICAVFEVWPAAGHREGYLKWAAELKTELLKMDGFISIERFQSLTDPDKLLSLQFWRDDACLTVNAGIDSNVRQTPSYRCGAPIFATKQVPNVVRYKHRC